MSTFGLKNRRETPLHPHRGQTLIELLVSLAIMSALMGSMVVTISVAARSIDNSATPVARISQANDVLDEIASELSLALSFTERTPRAVSFTVPDRDGDALRETIRYAWSGVPGDPITREYNGRRAVPIAENVHEFDLTYLLKTISPPQT